MVTTLVDSGGPLDSALRAPKQGAKKRAHQGDRAWRAARPMRVIGFKLKSIPISRLRRVSATF